MRVFVLGAGASGSLLAPLIAREGPPVWAGRKGPARGCHLLVNASPAGFNEIVLRAALRLRAHYLDLGTHLTRNPFKAEQLRYDARFVAKRRTAVITAGVAPGLTNLLVA